MNIYSQRRHKKSDVQQNRAYKWEDSFTKWAGPHMTQSAALETVASASRRYRIPIPEVIFPTKNKRSGKDLPSQYNPITHTITLRPRHLNGAIVLHEIAHAITDYVLGWYLDAHGPQWLGIYMVLLEDYGISTRQALHASADEAGLKYRTRDRVGPRQIRKRNRRRVREAKADRRL